jgi:tetratricopeptide (TPR) repeat protein
MAEDLKKENVAQEVSNNTSLSENESLQSVMGFFKKYQNYIGIALLAVAAVIVYFTVFKKKPNPTKELNAEKTMQYALYNISRDSFNIALNGDTTGPGLLDIIKKNKGTQLANQAMVHAAVCYLKTSKPKDAIKYLEDAGSGFGKQVNARKLSLLGDAKSDLGTENNTINNKLCEEAISYYEKAANEFKDDAMSASYLFKAAQLNELIGKFDAAKKIYVNIKETYPEYQDMPLIEKYLGKLGVEN